MDSLLPRWLFPVDALSFADGDLLPAGLFLLDGRTHVAALRSPTERALLAAGALRIATVHFDPDPHERSHPDRAVTRAAAARLAAGGSAG